MLDASIQSQVKVLENLIEYIFDRNACLIPSYLIINELHKFAENKHWPHWVFKFPIALLVIIIQRIEFNTICFRRLQNWYQIL